MGGAINIGIRYSDGSLVAGEVWTNPMPSMVREMSVLTTDAEIDAHLAAYMVEAVDGIPHNEIVPYGYGLVFFDVPTKSLLSMQGYTSFNLIHTFPHVTGRDEEVLEKLHQAGRISFDIKHYPPLSTGNDYPALSELKTIREGKSTDFGSLAEFGQFFNANRSKGYPDNSHDHGTCMYALDPWVKIDFPEWSKGAELFRAKLIHLGVKLSPAEIALWDVHIAEARKHEAENAREEEPA